MGILSRHVFLTVPSDTFISMATRTTTRWRDSGEIRDREKVFRGLKKMNTPIIEGMRVYYNFTKKHGSLKGQTPAERALIKVDGKNKWKTIIQNASLHRENSI